MMTRSYGRPRFSFNEREFLTKRLQNNTIHTTGYFIIQWYMIKNMWLFHITEITRNCSKLWKIHSDQRHVSQMIFPSDHNFCWNFRFALFHISINRSLPTPPHPFFLQWCCRGMCKFCCDLMTRKWFKNKWNFHHIWNVNGNSLWNRPDVLKWLPNRRKLG